jgi:4-amino-4-deoxy-L-arabinose transferase-like glycosyltransferase
MPSLPDQRLRSRDVALLLVVGLPLYLKLGHSLWGSESRWLFIAGHMLASGDWLEPNLQGQLYFDKPLLSYWAIVLAALPFGAVDEVAARLPSALAGGLTVLLTGWLGARLLGRRAGIFAGALLATSFSFVYWSRSASADLLNLLFTTAALALYVQSRMRLRSWQILAFWLLLALGGHAKGTPAIIIPLAVVAADVVAERRIALLRRWPLLLLGGVLALVVFALPFVISYAHRGDFQLARLMWRENFVRAFDPWDHEANPLYYFYILPAMFLPWSAWLPGAIGWSWRRRAQEPGLRLVLLVFWVILLAFTASESRRSYYILPVFPWAALLVAGFWDGLVRARAAHRTPARVWIWLGEWPTAIFAGIMLGVSLVVGVGGFMPGEAGALAGVLPFRFGLALPCGAAALATWLLYRAHRLHAAYACALLLAFNLFVYYATGVETLRDAHAMEQPFAREVKRRYPNQPVIYYGGGIGGNLQYYLGSGAELHTEKALESRFHAGAEMLLVVCGKAGPKCVRDTPTFTVERVLQVSTPAVGSMVPPKYKYSLLVCRRR